MKHYILLVSMVVFVAATQTDELSSPEFTFADVEKNIQSNTLNALITHWLIPPHETLPEQLGKKRDVLYEYIIDSIAPKT